MDDEVVDPLFDLDSTDANYQSELFCEEWVAQLSCDDKYFLAMFLQHHLCKTVGKGCTKASELAGLMIGR